MCALPEIRGRYAGVQVTFSVVLAFIIIHFYMVTVIGLKLFHSKFNTISMVTLV